MKPSSALLFLVAALMLAGCGGSKRPVLYPNSHFNQVGQQQAEMEVDACLYAAEASGANSGKGSELVKDTARAGAVGGATGAVVGAIASGSVGRGAAIGGAGAATATLVGGAFDAAEPTDIYIRFVDQCLREKGYQPIGWR